MFKNLLNWIKGSGGKSAGESGVKVEPGGLRSLGEIPRYPPFTEGFPSVDPAGLVETQRDLIDNIEHEIAFSDEGFERLVMPLIRSYAEFVHLVPASQTHHHKGAGGLLRHGLEVGLWATRSFHGRVFDGQETGEKRKILEPRWRLACFIAGLTHDLGKPAYDVRVIDESGRRIWDVYSGPLSRWLESEGIDRYFVEWRNAREHKHHEQFSQMMTTYVIPPAVMSYLGEGGPQIIGAMQQAIAGGQQTGASRVIYELIMKADKLSVDRDLKGQGVAAGTQGVGMPVASIVIDIMRQFIKESVWVANKDNGPLWVSQNSAYLEWEQAASDIIDKLNRDKASGVPRSSEAIAESLSQSGLILMQPGQDGAQSMYLSIVPELQDPNVERDPVRAVEIEDLGFLVDGPVPAPVTVHAGDDQVSGILDKRKKDREKRKERAEKERGAVEERSKKRNESMPVIADEPDQSQPPQEHDGAEASDTKDLGAHLGEVAETQPKAAGADAVEPITHESDEDSDTRQQTKNQSTETDSQKSDRSVESNESELKTEQDSEQSDSEQHLQEPDIDIDPDEYLQQRIKQANQVLDNCDEEAAALLREHFVPGPNSLAIPQGREIMVPHPRSLESHPAGVAAAINHLKPYLTPDPNATSKPVQRRKVDGEEHKFLVIGGELAQAVKLLATDPQQDDAAQSSPAEAAAEEHQKKKTKPSQASCGGKGKGKSKPKNSTKPKKATPPPKPKSPEKQTGQVGQALRNFAEQRSGEVTPATVEGRACVEAREFVSWWTSSGEGVTATSAWNLLIESDLLITEQGKSTRYVPID